MVAYKDRAVILRDLPAPEKATVFSPLIVIDGTVRGAWKRTLSATTLRVDLDFWTKVTVAERRAAEAVAARYGRFLGRATKISIGVSSR